MADDDKTSEVRERLGKVGDINSTADDDNAVVFTTDGNSDVSDGKGDSEEGGSRNDGGN